METVKAAMKVIDAEIGLMYHLADKYDDEDLNNKARKLRDAYREFEDRFESITGLSVH